MSDEVGFMTMGRAGGGDDVETIGIGMLGYSFMGKAHTNAYRTLAYMAWPPPLQPRLVAIAGRDEAAVTDAARRYGYEKAVTEWQRLIDDPDVQLLDNGGPNNLHAEPTIAAAEAGKHVFCEKPLARTAEESFEIWRRVAATGVVHMCAFNYRFVPAVRLARQLIEDGEIGEIHHFRGKYLQEWGDIDAEAWRFDKSAAGSGALGDLGAHVIDLARYLVGEIATVSALTATFKPGRTVDDGFEAAVGFDNGAIGTIEATASRRAGRTRSRGRSTARRARWRSTWSGSTSSRSHAAPPVSRPDWCRRRATRSGSGGGRTATCSAGSTRSCTRSSTCSEQLPAATRSRPTGRRSRTAIARRRSATR